MAETTSLLDPVGLRAAAGQASATFRRWVSELMEPGGRARIGRGLLYVLIALLPLHAGLVALGVPSLWKELVIGATVVIALTLPARASVGRVDGFFLVYFALVIASAAIHFVTNLADLAPYFVYVPFAITVPRLLVSSRHVAIMTWVAIASLLFNAAWMLAVRLDIVGGPDLLAVVGPSWNTTGSLTGGALATSSLYGVSAGVAWVAGGVSRHRLRRWLLALVLTAAGGLTGSRAAIVTSGLGLLLAIVLAAASTRSGPAVRALLAGLLLSMGLAVIVVGPHLIRADDSVRANRWAATVHVALDNPLLGAGPGATSQSRAIRHLGLDPRGNLPDTIVGTRVSESSALKVAAEIGFPGLVAITVWVVSVVVRAGPVRPAIPNGGGPQFLGPVIVLLTVLSGITVANMESFVGATLFWLGVGLCRLKLIDVSTELNAAQVGRLEP